jgi:hypothetical protein
MNIGDLVYHDMWGNGLVVHQQGVVNRWLVRFIEGGFTRFCWECDLEVLSESR